MSTASRLFTTEREELLRQAPFMRLATLNPDGRPHCVPMWFGYIDGQIYFKTLQNSVKARNLDKDSRIGLTVDLGVLYFDLRGLSILGEALLVTDEELSRRIDDEWVKEYLGVHHPMVKKSRSWPWAYYRVSPSIEFSWDYRRFRPNRQSSEDIER